MAEITILGVFKTAITRIKKFDYASKSNTNLADESTRFDKETTNALRKIYCRHLVFIYFLNLSINSLQVRFE
jgi:hypothetical protein